MPDLPYALIGAGPMGLACARQLAKYHIPFRGFELHTGVGGLWDIQNPQSTMYHSAHLISSKTMTEFREFPMGEEVATYPDHQSVCQYLNNYATHFKLRRFFSFGVKVLHTRPLAKGRWLVRWQDEHGTHEAHYAGLLIANGNLHKPNRPALPGQFTGLQLHACDYKSPLLFKDKRVLIIGCGNSACDIAVDAVHYAASVDLSVRRGYHFLPKFIAGRPIDTLGQGMALPKGIKRLLHTALIKWIQGKPENYGLPNPNHKLYESHPVVNSLVLHHLGHGDIKPRSDIQAVVENTVIFDNGDQQEYDIILQATGYKLDFPFIDKAHLNWKGHAPDLFLNIFHPEHKNLFVMGMVEAAGLGWQGRAEQAELVALLIKAQKESNQAVLKGFERQQKQHKPLNGGIDYLPLARMAYYVHKETYLNALRGRISQLKQGLGYA